MGSSQKIVNGVIWSTVLNIVNAIYGFIAVPILISHFGKSEYGLIGLAMSVNVYMRLMDMGFNSTNVRFFSNWLENHNYDRLNKGFQTSLSFYGIIGIINALILLIIGFFPSKLFNVTSDQALVLSHLFIILAVTSFCNWFSSCFDQIIKATENIAWLQKRTLITKGLMLIVLGMTVWLDFSIELYYMLTCIAQLIIVPLSIKKIRLEIPQIHFLPKWDHSSFKEMLPYCLNIFSFSLFQFSFYNLRPVFLGMQGTMESVADYRILNGIIGIVTALGGAFTGILLPSSAKAVARKDKDAFSRMAYEGTKYISIMICFCCFGMMSVGADVITLYVGKEYINLVPWLNLWLICTLGTHNQAISSLILAGSDIRAITYNSVLASVVGLILSWILIPYFDIGGVCIAFSVYMIIQIGFYYLYYWPRVMQIKSSRVFTQSFIPYVIIGALIMYATRLLPSFDVTIVSFLVKGTTFTIIYLFAVYIMLNENDKKFVLNTINRK